MLICMPMEICPYILPSDWSEWVVWSLMYHKMKGSLRVIKPSIQDIFLAYICYNTCITYPNSRSILHELPQFAFLHAKIQKYKYICLKSRLIYTGITRHRLLVIATQECWCCISRWIILRKIGLFVNLSDLGDDFGGSVYVHFSTMKI